jgi:prepilin-type N-terminal cleavage/methylation domain-containing protein
MKKTGFTLIEIILVIALVSITVGLTLPYMASYMSRQQLDATTEEIIGNLRRAQNKAIINEANTQWGISWHDSYYTLIKYPSGDEWETITLPDNIIISGSNVVFEKLTGQSSADTTITISHVSLNESKEININEEGKIQIQED